MRPALALLALLSVTPSPPSQLISQGPAHSRTVALTFDAGSDRGYAATILQTLERSRVHATFGMTGKWAEANPDLVRRMARDRDTFINHTFDHRSFTGFSAGGYALTREQRTWEITQTERVVRSISGLSTKPYFRPPYGDYDRATLTLARILGYRYTIMWTVDSLGWEHLPAASILQRCLAALRPGVIYLMHVGSQSQDGLALQPFLAALRQRGYRVVTIPQLLGGQ